MELNELHAVNLLMISAGWREKRAKWSPPGCPFMILWNL